MAHQQEGIECSCSVEFYQGDPAFFSSESIIPSLREYKCCECGAPIAIGEEYERVVGDWDFGITKYRTCLTCVKIRSAHCCTWIYSKLRDHLWEELGIDYITGEVRDLDEEERAEKEAYYNKLKEKAMAIANIVPHEGLVAPNAKAQAPRR